MWVCIPTIVLLASAVLQTANGDTAPLILSKSVLPTDEKGRENEEKPVISLEYKPIKPSYLSSGSNVAQIIPPGQPWPASAAGYANFSQLNPTMSTKYQLDADLPLLQSAQTQNANNMINLDLSDPSTDIAEALEEVLAPKLANVQITDKQQTISASLNIVPPPKANLDFVKAFQVAIRKTVSKLIPFAGTALRIAITKSSDGAVVNVKAYLNVVVPAAVKEAILPTSNVPEIDLTESTSGLAEKLRAILLRELSLAGYNPYSTTVHNFPLSFSILPPVGATRDYVKLNILRPLQTVLKSISSGAALTSVSVKTQESNGEVLRQTIKINVRVSPRVDFHISENVVEVPEVNLDVSGTHMVSTVVTTLQDQINENANVNPTRARTISIPFKIPAGTTQQQIQETYIIPISEELSKLDTTGKIFQIGQKTLPNGDVVIVINVNIPANTTITKTDNGQIQIVPFVPQTSTTVKPEVETSSKKQEPIDINNRNAQEDEISPETSSNGETAGIGTTESSHNKKIIPGQAITTSVVDLTTSTEEESLNNIKKILYDELSPSSNSVDNEKPKILAIPIRIKPPSGIKLEELHEGVVTPIEKLLTKLEPTGRVLGSKSKSLPNGNVECLVYFEIPSVKDSKIYKDLSEKQQKGNPTTELPTSATQAQVTTESAQEPVISPVTVTPQTQVPENSIKTTAIDLSHPNFDELKKGIEQRLKDLIKSNPTTSGKPQTVGFPFVVPKDQAKRIPIMAQAIVTLLKGLLPSGKAVADISPKVLPNGDVEFTIYYEIPEKVIDESSRSIIEEQTKPTVEEKNQVSNEAVVSSTTESCNIITVTATTPPKIDVEPKNSVLTSSIDMRTANPETLINEIQQRIKDVKANNNVQPEIIGLPFILPRKNVFIETALKESLRMIVPGKILPVSPTRNLPNGDIQYVVYFENPAVTNNKPTEGVIEEQTKPSIENKNGEIVVPETPNETQPPNSILTPPFDMKDANPETLADDIQRKINEVSGNNNGESQIIGLPFIMPKKNSFLETALKESLRIILPGKILPKTITKKLPNGEIEYIVFFEKPATTVNKPTEKVVEEQTKPSIENEKEDIATPETPETSNEVQPANSILIQPIDTKNANPETLLEDIRQKIKAVNGKNNEEPQIIGVPFIMSKRNPIIELALKESLRMVVPGKVLPKTVTKKLPNGEIEYIVFVEKPGTPINKPTEKVVEEQTKPSIENEKEEIATPETPETSNEVQPANSILIQPIDMKNADPETFIDVIRQKIKAVNGKNNEEPQIIGVPFIMKKRNFIIEFALKESLQMIVPGKILPKTLTKKLPNGEIEYIVFFEKPATSNNKPTEREVEERTKPSIENRNGEITSPETSEAPDEDKGENQNSREQLVFPTEAPETPGQPEGSIVTPPILLKQFDFETLKDAVEQRINQVSKNNNGQVKVVGLPFVLPSKSLIMQIGLEKVLRAILPGQLMPEPQTRVLPNGEAEIVFYYKLPVENRGKSINVEENQPEAIEDVNLDEPGVSIRGELSKALVRGVSSISSNPENLNKPANLKFNVYLPTGNTVSQNEGIIDAVSTELKNLEPDAKIISAKVNPNPTKTEPDGAVEIVLPSIASSKTSLNIKNAIEIPPIDTNVPGLNLVDTITGLLKKGLKGVGQLDPKGSQLFDLDFRLNPFDTKGSVTLILKALKTVDPKGQIVSHKITSGPDGLEYLEVRYLIPKLEDSILVEIVKPQEPEVVYESVVVIDTRNPMNGLLKRVISIIKAAQQDLKGTRKGQIVNLPLNFRFSNSRGLSDSEVSAVISQTLPYIRSYISQILPEGEVLSVNTVGIPDSDDVMLKIVVKTPYEPDNQIVIEEERPIVRTTPKPKTGSFFQFFVGGL